MNVSFFLKIFKGAVLKFLKQNKEQLIKILDAVIDKTTDKIYYELIDKIEKYLVKNWFERFIKRILIDTIYANRSIIQFYIGSLKNEGAENIVNAIILMIEKV